MQKRELTLGYKKKKDFDESLNRLIQIRNCIMHSNSLTILLEYYNVKEKSFRKSSDRKAYQKIGNHLAYKGFNYDIIKKVLNKLFNVVDEYSC